MSDRAEEPLVDGMDVEATGKDANMFKLKAAAKDAISRAQVIKETNTGPAEEKVLDGLPALLQKSTIATAIENERV